MDRPIDGWIYHFLKVMRDQREAGNEKAKDLKVRLANADDIEIVSFYLGDDKHSDVVSFTCGEQATNYLMS